MAQACATEPPGTHTDTHTHFANATVLLFAACADADGAEGAVVGLSIIMMSSSAAASTSMCDSPPPALFCVCASPSTLQ